MKQAPEIHVEYRVTAETIARFHESDAFYRFIIGPVGSSKTSALCNEVMRRAHEQYEDNKGVKRTRFCFIRNTRDQLRDTTIQTWLHWFPEETWGPFHWTDLEHNIRRGNLQLEVWFRALDHPEDVRRVLSMEVTAAAINEVREVPKSIVDAVGDRVGRYPSRGDGGCRWSGVIGDTNPPDNDHWIYTLAEHDSSNPRSRQLLTSIENAEHSMRMNGLLGGSQKLWQFFRQPGGLVEAGSDAEGQPSFETNPLAENLENLEPGYYLKRMAGKSIDHIRVYYCAQYGFSFDGKPIIHEYQDRVHCTAQPIPTAAGIPIQFGVDFGLTPAAIFGQRLISGRWTWIDELVSEDMGIEQFAKIFCQFVNERFAGCRFADGTGDPAGEQRSQTDETTPFHIFNQVLEEHQMPILLYPAVTNDLTIRREAIAKALREQVDGISRLLISPKCAVARKGLAGGYQYRRMKVAGEDRYHDKPDKNIFSHVVEAGGYMMLGAGEGIALIQGPVEEIEEKFNTGLRGASRQGGY